MTLNDTAKYLIHADIAADGVVERSDVVGAIFGQTEGLLGDDLDIHDLQQSSKVGRIDVEVASQRGQSIGEVTVATSMDKVETAVLGAALETIERIGPCRATIEVSRIEDVRAATRREVVERARDLLSTAFDDTVMSSDELLESVRESVRVEDVTEYEGYPAGPRVAEGDAIIVVEGRSDVLQLLRYGIKNAVAVEGTDVPEPVADLTRNRTATAFLDGDRGGELIMKELEQVADIDAVAFAPSGRSVEDLTREEVFAALREKVPFKAVSGASAPRELVAATDGSARPAPDVDSNGPRNPVRPIEPDASESTDSGGESSIEPDTSEPETLRSHVRAVIEGESGRVRLLDDAFREVASAPASEAFETVSEAADPPYAVVIDGPLTQRVLDVAAQRGVEQVIARERGQFTKRPTSVRIRTADELRG
ncbi:DNA primase DnaG [Halalkalicoccus salilacus]|uniref:DNA primase DnaG n=1 Tax=Halalkalicoccus salilacus TaxID=3117459 RepID=UPI00300E9C63